MYYIISLDRFNFIGKACEQLASQEHAFKFPLLAQAKQQLASWRANYPNARLLEVNEWEMCIKPVVA